MIKTIKFLFLGLLLVLVLVSACSEEKTSIQIEYEKCTAVCAAVLGDDFVTLGLCREECAKKFLE